MFPPLQLFIDSSINLLNQWSIIVDVHSILLYWDYYSTLSVKFWHSKNLSVWKNLSCSHLNYNCPSQWHPLTTTVLTPWKKSLKNRGVFNTLDNSKTPHLHVGKNLKNTLEHFSNIAQNGIKRNKNEIRRHILTNTLQKRTKIQGVFCTLDNLKSFFKHSGTFTNTLPTPPKFPLTPCQHPREFYLGVSLRGAVLYRTLY